MTKIGALTDIHGTNISEIVEDFRREQVSLVLLLGDFSGYGNFSGYRPALNLQEKQGYGPRESRPKVRETRYEMASRILKPLSTLTDVPVFVIGGNMDSGYKDTMSKVVREYHNFIDMESRNRFDLDGITILRYISPDMCFRLNPVKNRVLQAETMRTLLEDQQKLLKDLHECNGPTIVMSHHPPYGYGDATDTVDYYIDPETGKQIGIKERWSGSKKQNQKKYEPIYKKINAGDRDLTEIIEETKPTAVVFGHIHENNEIAPPALEIGTRIPVKPGEVVKSLALNTGPAMKENCYALLTVEEGNVSYELSRY